MDNNFLKRAGGFIVKYKYAVLVLLAGIVLMVMPSGKKRETGSVSQKSIQQSTQSVEEQLSAILSKVKGAGDVKVMLTTRAGEEIIYQTDTNLSTDDSSAAENTDTVIVTDSDRAQSGLVRQVHSPIYQGAIVLCHGAKNPQVRLAIIDAVSKVTGLGADKISVLEMK